ncbi:hypothetical protein GQ473_05770, partial [archaeon]|nr:hypothetical protein [archaeon]
MLGKKAKNSLTRRQVEKSPWDGWSTFERINKREQENRQQMNDFSNDQFRRNQANRYMNNKHFKEQEHNNQEQTQEEFERKIREHNEELEYAVDYKDMADKRAAEAQAHAGYIETPEEEILSEEEQAESKWKHLIYALLGVIGMIPLYLYTANNTYGFSGEYFLVVAGFISILGLWDYGQGLFDKIKLKKKGILAK